MNWIYTPATAHPAHGRCAEAAMLATLIGGKAAALARLHRANLPIPPWFALTRQAFEQSLDPARRAALAAGDLEVSDWQNLHPAPGVAAAIEAAVRALPGEGLFAVRSSAVDEDGTQHSFAGQLESFLFVPAEQVIRRVADVWRSGFSPRVLAYRREHGLPLPPQAPAVLVQRMIDAEVSGVAFAADPISGSRSTLIVSAVFGLGTALVGGDAEADTYRLRHDGTPIEQHIVRKSLRHVADPSRPGGVREEKVPDAIADRPALAPDQLQRIAELVLAVSRLEQRPQDIEWALAGGKLYLLQSRPVTSLAAVADPEGVRALWDNSNIAESYAGITTPLTFSFAQRAYEGAYRQFCRLMKVPAAVIDDNQAMFSQMLGLIRGRIYYNLLNWYRLLAMLPGFSVNRQFMEQMMGVREGLPPEVAHEVAEKTWSQRQAARLRLAWSLAGLVIHHFRLPGTIRAFHARLEDALAASAAGPALEQMRLDQLTAAFRRLESRLLTRWDAPLINDFLAMIFFGALGKAISSWCGPSQPGAQGAGENLRNDLLADEGGIISTEPVKRIAAMAELAAADETLVAALCQATPEEIEPQMSRLPALAAAYRAYLDKFGDRCLEELKLESPTLVDDPTPLLRSIGQTARRQLAARASGADGAQGSPSGARNAAIDTPRIRAEQCIAQALEDHPLKKCIFNWLLKHARGRVRDRENLRFERTRLFGRVRRIFVEIGRRLVAEGLLVEPRDIFYLTVDEVLGFVEGTSVETGLAAIVARRKLEFDRYRSQPAPADRFETRGAVYLGNTFAATTPIDATTTTTNGQLQGTGCCPGIVRGRVRLIRDPRGAHLRQGEILVAERTDPGWIMLFPAAAGVLVERGSLLSHSAIVARELGIPAIVSIPNLMRTLTDGQEVEMDGSTGIIRVIETHAERSP